MSENIVDAIRRVCGTHVWLSVQGYEDLLRDAAQEIERLRAENETLHQAAREIWARQMTCDDVYEYDLKRWPWLAARGKDE